MHGALWLFKKINKKQTVKANKIILAGVYGTEWGISVVCLLGLIRNILNSWQFAASKCENYRTNVIINLK